MSTSISEYTNSDERSHRAIWSRSEKDNGKSMKVHFHFKIVHFHSFTCIPQVYVNIT